MHYVEAVSKVYYLALNQVDHLFRLIIGLQLQMFELLPLVSELLKAVGHHVLVFFEILSLDALRDHQLLLEVLRPIHVPRAHRG